MQSYISSYTYRRFHPLEINGPTKSEYIIEKILYFKDIHQKTDTLDI